MAQINIAAVVVAAIASFAASGAWYAVLGSAVAELQERWRGAAAESNRPEVVEMLAFFTTALVVALTVAVLVDLTDISGVAPSAGLGVMLWVGFCATQWVGSILGENVPIKLAAIHAGDWLMHMLVITVIVGIWR